MRVGPRVARRRAALTLALALAGLLAAAETAAAPPPKLLIQAQLDKNRVTVGEEAQVTVVAEANGVNLPDYALPTVPGLKIMRVANSQSFSWVNGRLSRSTTSVFLVSASAPGRYTIPPVRIVSGGASAQTEPLVLDVGGAGSTPSAPGPSGAPSPEASIPRVWGDQSLPELFVRLVVDRRRVYWNQQVTARFILYARERLDEVPMWEVAEANGFWKTALGDLRRGRVRVGNNDYVAYEQDVAYFPTRTGRLTLGPGRIEVRVARSIPAPDPFSLLGLPETQVETVPLQTENATIEVMPLPGSPPPTFRGAVGRLAMDVKVDRLVAHAGEPVTVTTVLHGRGNLNTAGDPDVEATLPLRTFEAPGAVTTRDAGLDVSGERRHDKAFVPEVPGSFAIEPIRFTWFDPEEGRFRTQFSDSIRIRVVPGGESTAATAGPSEPPAAPRHRSGPRGGLSLGPPRGAVALGAGSFAALATAALLATARRRSSLDPRRRRRSALDRIAREIGAIHGAGGAGSGRASTLVAEALGVRYGADVEGRSREETLRMTREAGAEEATVEEARRLLDELERAAFAPAGPAAGGGSLAAAQAFVERLAREAP